MGLVACLPQPESGGGVDRAELERMKKEMEEFRALAAQARRESLGGGGGPSAAYRPLNR